MKLESTRTQSHLKLIGSEGDRLVMIVGTRDFKFVVRDILPRTSLDEEDIVLELNARKSHLSTISTYILSSAPSYIAVRT